MTIDHLDLQPSEPEEKGFIPTFCPQCGFDVPIDEDGCCTTCGADACGDGVDMAHALRDRVAELEELEDLYHQKDRCDCSDEEAYRYVRRAEEAERKRDAFSARVAELEAAAITKDALLTEIHSASHGDRQT